MSSRIGALTLTRVLGEGAQGTVWEAHHAYSGAAVAVKVLRAEARPHFHRLRQEAEALARLAHPGVVAVLDVGQVAPDEATPTLPEGSPWLAMERIGGARPLQAAPSWDAALATLLALLDALAHCHARDVVHRDLKPGNVLVRDSRVCLTDFGLAWLGDADDARLRAGTPPYMAPEQFLGRPVGPRTDPYALGCLACTLVQGRPPFPATTLPELREQHLYHPPAPEPAIPVPDRFLGWLERLLAKSPSDRFRSAAVAADALADLGPTRSGPVTPSQAELDARTWVTGLPHSVVLDPVRGRTGRDAPTRGALRPVPPSWRTPYPVALDDIHASGFGLHALRDPPLVGRETERDALWAALRDVAATGRGRTYVIAGPEGSGRWALIRWLRTRAAELDVATLGREGPAPRLRIADVPERVDGSLTLVRAREIPAGAEGLELGPLSEGELRRLLDHRVRLDPLLTARLAWRAQGSPGRAVALLADVVPQLVQGDDGPGLPRPLPAAPSDLDEAALLHDLEAPHLPLLLPARAIGAVDALRAFLDAAGRPDDDPSRSRADIVEAWICANLHLTARAGRLARRVLRRAHATDAQRRDAHLIQAKCLMTGDAELRLEHLLAAQRYPPHELPANRLRQWRSLLIALRELGDDDAIAGVLDRIALDPALSGWAMVERVVEERRKKRPVDLDPLLTLARGTPDPELVKAVAGVAFAAGRLAEGEALLRGLLDQGLDSAVVRCNLGWIIASQGRLDEVPPLVTTVTEADADVLSSVALLKAYVHAADPQLDVEAYLMRFEPALIGAPFREHTCRLLDDLAARAEAAGLVGRAVLARRHGGWLRKQVR